MSKVCVVGLGYMGLPMAAILARAGHDVVGVDINPKVVERVNQGVCPFSEPGMPELIAEAHKSGRLKAVAVPEAAEIYVLSLPTPVDHTTHEADMSYVVAGARSLAPVLQGGELVVLESTSPIGATRRDVKDVIEKLRPELAGKVEYVFCPERAIPGNTLKEMVENDRLVGGLTPEATARGKALYASFCKGALLEASAEEAEMVKLVENASRDVQLAFCNELHMVCDRLGLDFFKVVDLANHHPRVNIFKPNSAGVGGHCIAVDPWFIINAVAGYAPLMRAARGVNDAKPGWVLEKVQAVAKPGAVVACLGLAYKPDVDDLRESPGVEVARELVKQGYDVRVVEPHLDEWEIPLVGLEAAVGAADVVVTLTGHSAFKGLDRSLLKGKAVVDAVGLWR